MRSIAAQTGATDGIGVDDAYPLQSHDQDSSLDLAPVLAERRLGTIGTPGTDRADHHPARVYLLRLAPSSRPVMRGALQIAELLTASQFTWETMP
jgi:hypothetical protein